MKKLVLHSIVVLAGLLCHCSGGGGRLCPAGDLECFLDSMRQISPGGNLRELTPISVEKVSSASTGSMEPEITNQPPPMTYFGDTQTLQLNWYDPHGHQPAFCMKLCQSGGSCTKNYRCTQLYPDEGETGAFHSFLSYADPKQPPAQFNLHVVPLTSSEGLDPIEMLNSDGSKPLRGNEVIVAQTVYPKVDDGPGPGCPSIYDGTYIGQLAYQYETSLGQWSTKSIQFSITLECMVAATGSVVLEITNANIDEPQFGCNVGGCTPKFGSVAILPEDPPTSPSNPSTAGEGFVLMLPNGSTITAPTDRGDQGGIGELVVSSDGRTIENSLDASIVNDTWQAYLSGGKCFPNHNTNGTCSLEGSDELTRYQSWTLTKSAK